MRKIYITIFMLLLFSQLLANPIEIKYMSEIYFEDDNWTIELAYTEEMGGWWFFQNLDNLRLVSTADTAQFNSGISLDDVNIILVTQDSLQAPLSINKNGDCVQLQEGSEDEWWFTDEIRFGDYPGSWVNAPYEGQSLVGVWYNFSAYAKDNIPSLGIPWTINTFGSFCGNVLDLQGNPIPSATLGVYSPAWFGFIYPDETGHFEFTGYGMNYEVTVYVDTTSMLDTLITVEPDSTTWCDFYINLPSVGEEQLQPSKTTLSNYPNPFIESTAISFTLDPRDTENAEIKIYNIKGQVVKQFKIKNSKLKISGEVVWDEKDENGVLQAPGVYFYSLEIDGRKVRTNKMIMVR
jgi:hypothetical protein